MAWLTLAARAEAPAAATQPATEAHVIPPVNDRAILKAMPGESRYKIPQRIYTEAFLKGAKAGTHPNLLPAYPNRTRAELWLNIPEDQWAAMVLDIAPVTAGGGQPNYAGKDPFSNDPFFRGCGMTDEQFLKNPFIAYTLDGNHPIYGRDEDMPADWALKPNVTVEIPHLDGTKHAYRFHAPPGTENAPPSFNSDRRHWISPAGEAWRQRLRIIMFEVFPDLALRVYETGDPKAVRILTVLLDRFADVYPSLPLVSQSIGHGLARNEAGKDYLTRDEYLATVAQGPFRDWNNKPFWFHSIYDYNYAKLNWGISSWTDGVLDHLADIGTTFDLIRDTPAVKQYSKEKYNDEMAWERKIRLDIFSNALQMTRVTPPTVGNTSYGYIRGGSVLGILTGDEYLFNRALSIVDMYLTNNWLVDGMPHDAAFNYAMMTYGIINYRWMTKVFGGVDLKDRYPILHEIEKLTFRPVATLYNVESKHADEHNRFFRGLWDWMPPPAPDKVSYPEHELSQCFPVYGYTMLRGGEAGSRMELSLDHMPTGNHSHYSRMNLQMFYEGVEVLPDFGYGVGYIEPDKEPWKSLSKDYPLEMMDSPCEADKWGPWRHTYTMLPESHCLAMVDYWLYAFGPTQLMGYRGGMPLSDPGYWAQFVDASAAGLFKDRPNPVDVFRRQVAMFTLPNGRSLALDTFRIHGGQRHDLYWHVPSDLKQTTLSQPAPIEAKNLFEYMGYKSISYDKLTGETIQHYARAPKLIEKLHSYATPRGVWSADYLIEPHKFLPKNPKTLERYSHWPKLLHDVNFRLWGDVAGSETTQNQIIGAYAPWPALLEETDPNTGEQVRGLVAFRDAMHMLIPSRVAEKPGLESTFVHVLEPRNPSQEPAVKSVDVVHVAKDETGGGVTTKVDLMAGGSLWALSTLHGEAYVPPAKAGSPAVELTGRCGAAIPEAGYLSLYDGSKLRVGNWQLDLQPSWRLKLLGVIGDMTGQPDESALIVQSDLPLPTDKTLAGTMLFVQHRIDPQLSTGYTIAAVSSFGEQRYRIDLANLPPFVEQRMHAWKIDEKDPALLYHDMRVVKGGYERSRIRFPRSGFETEIVTMDGKTVKLAATPPEGAVKEDDAFVVFKIQAGDEVTIPSHFACRKQDGKLQIVSTGPASLRGPDGLTITLTAKDLADGRAEAAITK
ncbi:MAG: hypothetical protein IT440_04620 [Phycisphaeraceae bacterium]|nr:hypothetical protein [Phycisphaeraceae bacterium]